MMPSNTSDNHKRDCEGNPRNFFIPNKGVGLVEPGGGWSSHLALYNQEDSLRSDEKQRSAALERAICFLDNPSVYTIIDIEYSRLVCFLRNPCYQVVRQLTVRATKRQGTLGGSHGNHG